MSASRPFSQFKTYYLQCSRAGTESECDFLLRAVDNNIHSVDWSRGLMILPKDLSKARTIMISCGCEKTAADRVIKYYRQWYNSLYK